MKKTNKKKASKNENKILLDKDGKRVRFISLERPKKAIKNLLQFLSKYYIIISTVPLVIGGIHQIYKLLKLGVGYLRFFSATQLLLDGLVFLFIILGFIIYLGGVLMYAHTYNHTLYESIDDINGVGGNDKELIGWTNFVLISMVIISFIIGWGAFLNFFDYIRLSFQETFKYANSQYELSIAFEFIYLVVLMLIAGNINVYRNNKYRTTYTKFLLIWTIVFFVLFTGNYFQPFFKDFQSFSRLEHVGNYQNHQNKLLKAYPNYTKTEILYFNDKFIFTELSSPDNKTIIITKMDEFIGLNETTLKY